MNQLEDKNVGTVEALVDDLPKHTIGSPHPNLEVENASLMCFTPPPWYIVRTRFTQSNFKQRFSFLAAVENF